MIGNGFESKGEIIRLGSKEDLNERLDLRRFLKQVETALNLVITGQGANGKPDVKKRNEYRKVLEYTTKAQEKFAKKTITQEDKQLVANIIIATKVELIDYLSEEQVAEIFGTNTI